MLLRRGLVSVSALVFVVVGLIAYDIWRLIEGGNGDVSESNAGVAVSESTSRLTPQTGDPAFGRNKALPDEARPGSMRATLLNTADGNRNHIFQLTIADSGFECPGVRNASGVGGDGYVWRVHCGDTLVYWVEVDDFGRLLVMPIPYGDFEGSLVPIRRALPLESPNQQDQFIPLPLPR